MAVPAESTLLLRAMVDAYRPYVTGRVPDLPAEVVGAGEEWLEDALKELLGQPFPTQSRGPLEVFQEAVRLPNAWLTAQDREPPVRDPAKVSALPGDTYDLAPASSQELGEDVWRLHLAWGAAKAAAITRPGAESDRTD